jgi:hypothetical protein
MKKLVFIIILQLIAIVGTAYYGYTVYTTSTITPEKVDMLLTDVDAGIDQAQIEGLQDETVTSIESEINSGVAVIPASFADIDAAILEINTFSNSDVSVFNAQLTDLQ